MPVLMILLFWPNAYFHEKNHHLVAFLLFFYCLFYSLSLFFWVSWGLIWTSSLSIYFKWWPTVQILLNFFLLVDKNHFGVLYGHIKYVNILQFLFEIISNFFFFCFFGNLCLVIFWWVKQSAIQISSQNLSITQKIFIFFKWDGKETKIWHLHHKWYIGLPGL